MQIKKHFDSGVYYEGEVNQAGQAEGYGICTYPNGTEYRGYYHEDLEHGRGTVTYPTGWRLTGTFQEGYFEGAFRIDVPDGRVYQCTFHNGYVNDQGEFLGITTASIQYGNGDSYEGGLDTLLREHGNGKLTNRYGFVVEGTFSHGMPEGMMTIRQPNGVVMRGNQYGRYFSGTWSVDWPDGHHMRAEMKGGYMDAEGRIFGIESATVTYPDGEMYTGGLTPDLKSNGYGTLYKRSGEILAGIWTIGLLTTRDNTNSWDPVADRYRGGSSRSNPQAILWTILEKPSYHCLLIYKGSDTTETPVYRIDMSEVGRVFAGSQPYTYIRDYESGGIAYTLVKEAVYGVYQVRSGDKPFVASGEDVCYTVSGDLIAIGDDRLMNHISFRIRDLGYKKVIEFRR